MAGGERRPGGGPRRSSAGWSPSSATAREVESLAPVKYTITEPDVCLSPDGRTLLWTSVDHFGSDLKLLEGFTGL